MAPVQFPPVERANSDGVLAMGGDLSLSTLRTAYRSGIFPWPVEGYPLLWFAPRRRAILRFDEMHIAHSLSKLMRHCEFEVRIDTAFEAVIRNCAAQREYAEGTWITDDIIEGYLALHRAGDAHSVETYLHGELVGGLYGVAFGAYFAGESMFYRVSGASKVALVHLVRHLHERSAQWLDVEVLNPFFATFGAREVPRAEFMEMLQEALSQPLKMFD